MFYVNLVITGKKSLKDMQNVKTDESEDITTKSQITKEDSKRGRKKKKTTKLPNSEKSIHKMGRVSPYLSIITLNVNGLNSLIKRQE